MNASRDPDAQQDGRHSGRDAFERNAREAERPHRQHGRATVQRHKRERDTPRAEDKKEHQDDGKGLSRRLSCRFRVARASENLIDDEAPRHQYFEVRVGLAEPIAQRLRVSDDPGANGIFVLFAGIAGHFGGNDAHRQVFGQKRPCPLLRAQRALLDVPAPLRQRDLVGRRGRADTAKIEKGPRSRHPIDLCGVLLKGCDQREAVDAGDGARAGANQEGHFVHTSEPLLDELEFLTVRS